MEGDTPSRDGVPGDRFATFVVNAERRLSHEAALARRLALITGTRADAGRAEGLDQAARILIDMINE